MSLFGNCFQIFFFYFLTKIMKTYLVTKTVFYLFFLKKKKSVFREHFLVVFNYFHLFFKDNFFKKIIQICKTIKNKILHIKIIFKTYLKIF